jgi:hypothetical protein
MIRPIVRGTSIDVPEARSRRTDLAMNILQYGTAIVAILVVTLLAVAR